MNKTGQQIIDQSREESLKDFLTKEIGTIYDMVQIMLPKSRAEFITITLPNLHINLFHRNTATLKAFVGAEIERLEGMKVMAEKYPMLNSDSTPNTNWNKAYNSLLQDQITHLKEIKI